MSPLAVGGSDSGSGSESGTCLSGTFVSGTCQPRSTTTTPTTNTCPDLLGTHPHLDREQHRHGELDCHDSTPGHQHSDGTTDTSGSDTRYEGLNDELRQIGCWIATGTTAALAGC
ncbi:MAG: hypothetical protein OXF65_01790 [Acidimicrobiaceae bacterium]|nr:hypothetical protein [Acidimicrobiaceae bacterium]